MKYFTLNGKKVEEKELSFNAVCDFEDMGVDVRALSGKPLSLTRAYIAYAEGITLEEAGKEIEAHILNGGDMDKVMDAISSAFRNSDFFHHTAEMKKKASVEKNSAKAETAPEA